MNVSFINQLARDGRRTCDGIADTLGVLTTKLHRHEISEATAAKRLTLVFFGDYAEAFWRFKNGGPETYHAQKYTVQFVESLVKEKAVESVTSVGLSTNRDPTVLPNGVRTLGVELYPKGQSSRHRQLVEAVRSTNPTHLIVGLPSSHLISWGIRARIPVLPMLADSFRSNDLQGQIEMSFVGAFAK